MQIKRHWFLVETMPFEYFFSGVNTPASCSKQAARATPKGSLRLLCAGDTENSKQPEFYVEPELVANYNIKNRDLMLYGIKEKILN